MLTSAGLRVSMEAGAGVDISFGDEAYMEYGVRIVTREDALTSLTAARAVWTWVWPASRPGQSIRFLPVVQSRGNNPGVRRNRLSQAGIPRAG